MGDHDYGTHDTNLCAECLGYAIGKRVALREAAEAIYDGAIPFVTGNGYVCGWLIDRANAINPKVSS